VTVIFCADLSMMIMIFARGLREHERDKRRGEGAGNIHEGDGRQRCLPAQDSDVGQSRMPALPRPKIQRRQ
jgi:hypothetical protein